jgi:hypothetical protein
MDVKFIDASQWVTLEWYNSGGTRAKRVLQSPDGAEWYFKCSEKKPAKDNKPEKYYRYEFWSEIIAYQIGNFLGLNILRYDIAVHDNEIGCISPLMIKPDKEQLIEVGRYMTSLNSSFLPEDYSTRKEYTFQLLEQTLIEFDLVTYFSVFFQTILFDTIIGNTDRHQENWAFIGNTSFIAEMFNEFEKDILEKPHEQLPYLLQKMSEEFLDKDKKQLNKEGQQEKLKMASIISMAPIYDNGSSLARELSDEKVMRLLNNPTSLLKYIEAGKAEIHWEGEKLSHFMLVGNLLNSSYLEVILKAGAFLSFWANDKVKEIINNIDKNIPLAWHSYCIPQLRKDLIVKLLILRFEKLQKLLNDRIRQNTFGLA